MASSSSDGGERAVWPRHETLEVDFDQEGLQEAFKELISNLVATLSADTIGEVHILPKPTKDVELYQVHLIAYSVPLTIVVRRDNLYFIGYRNKNGWFECGFSKGKGKDDRHKGKKHKSKTKEQNETPKLIDGAVYLPFKGCYHDLLQHMTDVYDLKLSKQSLMDSIKNLGNSTKDDLSTHEKYKIMRSFATICMFISECSRFTVVGNKLIKTLDGVICEQTGRPREETYGAFYSTFHLWAAKCRRLKLLSENLEEENIPIYNDREFVDLANELRLALYHETQKMSFIRRKNKRLFMVEVTLNKKLVLVRKEARSVYWDLVIADVQCKLFDLERLH